MLKLYTDQNLLTAENRSIVFPLLFDLWYLPNANLLGKYQIISEIKDCDIVVVAVDIAYFSANKRKQELDNFINKALSLNKKVWVYSAGDYGKSLNVEVYTFRLGGFGSKLNSSTHILPSFIEDPYLKIKKNFHPITKSQLPQIGFVGHASNTWSKKRKEILVYLIYNIKRWIKMIDTDYQDYYSSSSKRYQLLTLLQKTKDIKTNFVFRSKYRAGVKTVEEKNKTTMEFYENMAQNPYTFCLRGAGNFSVRFYETLAMGRIPFVIDTDFRLPLNEYINWEKHCIIVKEKHIEKILIDFHQKISSEDFELMQLNNRKLWENYLEREAYFLNIYSVFKIKE